MIKPEFSKTSLHNHFGGDKADYKLNDEKTRFFDIELAKKKIDQAENLEFQLLAMTNSNHFWSEHYLRLNDYIHENHYRVVLIPGVEFNVVEDISKTEGDRKYLHLVFLVSPKSDLLKFELEVTAFRSKNNINAITVSNLVELASNYKCILIPHGTKQNKSERDSLSNIGTFDDILSIRDFIPIMIEDNKTSQREFLETKIKQMISPKKFNWISNAASISSADRMDFTSITQPTYIWGEPTFDSLFYCAIIGKDRVLRETDINEKSKYIKSIIIKNNGGSISSGTLHFSHGLNSIIGNSGSGKTLLLNLIKFKLTEEKLNFAVSSSDSNYDSMYDKVDFMIIDNNGNPVKPKDINVFEGENLYSQIITTIKYNKDQLLKNLNATPKFDKTESLIANFNKELNRYITNRINTINSKSSIDDLLIKVFASIDYLSKNSSVPGSIEYLIDSKISTNLQEYDLSKKNIDIDLQSTKKAFDYLNQMFAKYGLASNIDKMSAIRFELFKQILLNRNSLNTQSIIKNAELIIKTKISEVVSEYNNNIGQRTKLVYQSKQIISDETEKIIATLKKITLLNEELDLPYLDEKSIIDSVTRNDEIIKLANFEINKDILYDDLGEYFDSSIGSGNNKVLKSEFAVSKNKNESLYPINLFSKDSVRLFAEIFVKNNYTNSNIFRLNPGKFIKFDIMIRNLDDEYQQISSLSAGQLSKIYINMLIDNKLKAMENNAIILYDQPDNNLEKAFIYDTLGRKLADLKKRYQVIITTHEPLLVVNSDSNSIIRADNDPVAGVSKIKYENLSMYDVGDKKAAIDKIAKLIDGSHDAIKKRNQLYGGFDI